MEILIGNLWNKCHRFEMVSLTTVSIIFACLLLSCGDTSRPETGHDTVMHHEGPLISSAAIIGIVIAVLFILIIVIDVICCCANKTGIIFYVCERSRRKPVDEDDAKLGREEKEPLREEKKITPIIDSGLRRETSVNFNGKTSVSKTGFVGKDSAV